MSKNTTRRIAVLFLISALVLMSVKGLSSKNAAQPAVKDGYTEISKKEYEELKQEKDQWQAKYKALEESDKGKEEAKPDENLKQVHVAQLTISKGMTSKEVSSWLAKVKVINKAKDLDDYLAKEDLQESVRMGEYEVSSEMDIKEIAHIITGK